MSGPSRPIRIKIRAHLIRTNYTIISTNLNANQMALTLYQTEFGLMSIDRTVLDFV